MSALSDMSKRSIWDFALALYNMPGVEADCLTAQDLYGLDVTALIFALYRTSEGVGFDGGQAGELARSLSARVIEPLRAVRIALKSSLQLVEPEAAEALRKDVKLAELDAERLALYALDRLPRSTAPALSYEAALHDIVQARQISADNHLTALLKRLALSAQNV
jgi:uncharacterized protein (TIGR02444 family)